MRHQRIFISLQYVYSVGTLSPLSAWGKCAPVFNFFVWSPAALSQQWTLCYLMCIYEDMCASPPQWACQELIPFDVSVRLDPEECYFWKVPLLCFWHNESLSGQSFQRAALCISKASRRSFKVSFMLLGGSAWSWISPSPVVLRPAGPRPLPLLV